MTWLCQLGNEEQVCREAKDAFIERHRNCGEPYPGNPHPEINSMWVWWNAADGPCPHWLVDDTQPGKAIGMTTKVARDMHRQLRPPKQNERLDAIIALKKLSQ